MRAIPSPGGVVWLSIAGITCGTCEDSIQRALRLLPGVQAVRPDHRAGRVEVDFAPPEAIIRKAVEDAGHDLEAIGTG